MRLAALLLSLAALLAFGQEESDKQLKEAGVCARCHVISVVEWGVAKHWKTGTNCISCHGVSTGHVVDERNNIKPDRMPLGAGIARLCLDCHADGCPKVKKTTDCQNCHHVHALVNPQAPPPRVALPPSATPVPKRDATAGLAKRMVVPGAGVEMVLVAGGDVDLGADGIANARPVHTVRVRPFYLSAREVTVGEWQAVMGAREGASSDARMPATGISWNDAQAFVAKLNATVPGGGFRLPTEAEWEFAARAGSNEDAVLDGKAPRAAGQGKPNALGLYDLRGNVWEWCSTLLRDYPYDAADGRESLAEPGMRILRGGGYADAPSWITPATRHPDRVARRLPWYGLRLARSTPAR